MKISHINVLALLLALLMLFTVNVYAEDSVDISVDVTPGGYRMSYGYQPLQSWDGTRASNYVKGVTPPTSYVGGGDSYTVSANSYTFRDYVFAGWSCNGKLYQPGEVIYNVNSSMTFIAQWARPERPDMVVHGIVSYTENGKVTEALSVEIGKTVTLNEGLWKDASGRVFEGGSAFLLSFTTTDFTACERAEGLVTVQYKGANNGVQSSFAVEKNKGFRVDGCYEKRPGFVFTGWKIGDRVYLAGDTYTATENTSFTAIWQEESKPMPDYCTVNIKAGEGGTSTPNGKNTVVKGESLTFDVKANKGYALQSVVCGGEELGTGGTYTIKVNNDINVAISFIRTQAGDINSDDVSAEEYSDISTDESRSGTDKTGGGFFGAISDLFDSFGKNPKKFLVSLLAIVVCLSGVALAIWFSNNSRKR